MTTQTQLLLKLKSDSGSVFSQIFDSGSGSEGKTQNPAGVDSGTSDPCPPLPTRQVPPFPPFKFAYNNLKRNRIMFDVYQDMRNYKASWTCALLFTSCFKSGLLF